MHRNVNNLPAKSGNSVYCSTGWQQFYYIFIIHAEMRKKKYCLHTKDNLQHDSFVHIIYYLLYYFEYIGRSYILKKNSINQTNKQTNIYCINTSSNNKSVFMRRKWIHLALSFDDLMLFKCRFQIVLELEMNVAQNWLALKFQTWFFWTVKNSSDNKWKSHSTWIWSILISLFENHFKWKLLQNMQTNQTTILWICSFHYANQNLEKLVSFE